MDSCIDIHVGSITLDMFRNAAEVTRGEDYLRKFCDDQLAKADLVKDLGLDFIGITKIRLQLETWYRIKIEEPPTDQAFSVADFCALKITPEEDYRCWITLSMLCRAIEATRGRDFLGGFSDARLAKADLLNDLGFDSLDIIETQVNMENMYNIRIREDGAETVRTVADFLALEARFKSGY